MIKVVNGIEKVLGMNDFLVNKLSDRLGLIEFNEYTNPKKKAKDVNGNEFDYYVFAVKRAGTAESCCRCRERMIKR